MAAFFDETEIKKRVTQRLKRRFLLTLHVFFALAVFLTATVHSIYIQETFSKMQFDWLLWRNMAALVFFVGIAPLILHVLWVRYRDQVEREIERELHNSGSYGKRKHDDHLAHLYDTGEFVPSEDDEDYPQKRLERR